MSLLNPLGDGRLGSALIGFTPFGLESYHYIIYSSFYITLKTVKRLGFVVFGFYKPIL